MGEPRKIPIEGERRTSITDNARAGKQPLNNAESARISTLTAIMGGTSIYEKRVVGWAEVDV